MMLVETVIASITVITCGSLWLANSIVKRTYVQLRNLDTSVEILPFEHVHIGTQCQKCGESGQDRGPALPKACNKDQCPARHRPHLHMICVSCGSKWFMAPRKNGSN
jgi:hypothetical protein